jgi:hypothetical protein
VRHSPRTRCAVVERFEIWVESAFEGRCWREVKIDDVSRVIYVFVSRKSIVFLANVGEVASLERHCIEHNIFIVDVWTNKKGKGEQNMIEMIKHSY